MGLFFWKNNQTIDTFANAAANSLFSAIQPQAVQAYMDNSMDDRQAKKFGKTMDRAIQDQVNKIKEFIRLHSLGVYGKARLHLKIRERLVELGYSSDVVVKIDQMIMLKTP